jgi:hypothetical protein
MFRGRIVEGGKLEGGIRDRGTFASFFILPSKEIRNSVQRIPRNSSKSPFSEFRGIPRSLIPIPTEFGNTGEVKSLSGKPYRRNFVDTLLEEDR